MALGASESAPKAQRFFSCFSPCAVVVFRLSTSFHYSLFTLYFPLFTFNFLRIDGVGIQTATDEGAQRGKDEVADQGPQGEYSGQEDHHDNAGQRSK